MNTRIFGVVEWNCNLVHGVLTFRRHAPACREQASGTTAITAVEHHHAGESNPDHSVVNRKVLIREPVHMVRQHQVRREVPPPPRCHRILSTAPPRQTARPVHPAHQPPVGMRSRPRGMRSCAASDAPPLALSPRRAGVNGARSKTVVPAFERRPRGFLGPRGTVFTYRDRCRRFSSKCSVYCEPHSPLTLAPAYSQYGNYSKLTVPGLFSLAYSRSLTFSN